MASPASWFWEPIGGDVGITTIAVLTRGDDLIRPLLAQSSAVPEEVAGHPQDPDNDHGDDHHRDREELQADEDPPDLPVAHGRFPAGSRGNVGPVIVGLLKSTWGPR